jgi:hypothetical protein
VAVVAPQVVVTAAVSGVTPVWALVETGLCLVDGAALGFLKVGQAAAVAVEAAAVAV